MFYAPKKTLNSKRLTLNSNDILVKCLLNGEEATLPVPTDSYPYYKWSDFKTFYAERFAKYKQ